MNASPAAASVSDTSRRVWLYPTVSAFAGGLLLGVLTNLAQGWLPGAWNQIPNSGAVWSVAAFAAGALLARQVSLPAVAVAGLCAESGLVVGYYGYAEVARVGMGSLFAPLIWLGMAFIAGPLFGVAGSWWRGCSPRYRVIGLAALAGVFGMEAIQYAWVLHYVSQAWACLAVLVLVALLMGRTHKERVLTLLTAMPFSLLAYLIFEELILRTVLG
ncbi:hypothetical protein GCM10011583_66230 [Streptomyces camponoticapitis]|uniref:Integral membrane protein n=1 Tax=Streptomyces camponoticapitis TaxID=1616125 RepID=A0ABQ2ETG7_9ACTN|nr:DUF6518 family protein [Streptomyces camponoticapitis]GGK24925.1 hypothetical protein GCM10011583_66230 [Streptomyces camponoticapitis]